MESKNLLDGLQIFAVYQSDFEVTTRNRTDELVVYWNENCPTIDPKLVEKLIELGWFKTHLGWEIST